MVASPTFPPDDAEDEALDKLLTILGDFLEKQHVTENERDQAKAELALELGLKEERARKLNVLIDKVSAATSTPSTTTAPIDGVYQPPVDAA